MQQSTRRTVFRLAGMLALSSLLASCANLAGKPSMRKRSFAAHLPIQKRLKITPSRSSGVN